MTSGSLSFTAGVHSPCVVKYSSKLTNKTDAINQRKWRSCPLPPVQIWLFAGTEHNFFLSRIHFHCLHTSVSFLSVTKGSFVFLLILLTVFVPLPHCHETLTVKVRNCLHQKPALERVQIQLQHLENLFHMYQMSVEYFSAASERHLSHPRVNWPWRHVVRAAQSLRRSLFSYEARPGMLVRFPLCFLLL